MGDGLERDGSAEDRCPRCGVQGLSIVYGLPGPDLERAALRGEVVLGGCCVEDGQPDRQCASCRYTWRRSAREPLGE